MDGASDKRLPVTIVTGFLGSGKTTLINAALRDPVLAGTMVIVNEFGAVGLDHLLISSADDQVLLLDSGCLCCAVSGTLRDTLIDLFARRASGSVAPFDRVLVETSGLANPAPLVATLLGDSALAPRCMLAQVLTLVDAANGRETLARYAEAQRQVAFADQLLVSKTDTAKPDEIEALEQVLAALNAQASIGRWKRGGDAGSLFAASAGSSAHAVPAVAWLRGPIRPQYGADADDESQAAVHGGSFGRISTHVLAFSNRVGWASYADWTQKLSSRLGKRLLRCKGLLALGDGDAPWVVQAVQGYFAPPERLSAWPELPPRGFLVVIGESITRAELEALMADEPALTHP